MNAHAPMKVVAVSAAGREVHLATPEEHGVPQTTLLICHDGKHVDLLDLADKILDLSAKPVSFDLAPQPELVKSPYPSVRSGTPCYCLHCGHEDRAYGGLVGDRVSAAWCGNCERNDTLIPLDKLDAFLAENAETIETIETSWVLSKGQQFHRCSNPQLCDHLRPCEQKYGDTSCPKPDQALPLMGFVRRPIKTPVARKQA